MLPLAPAATLLAWGQLRFAGYIKDDAFISLRFARNFAEGAGFTFNPGAPALEGFTNFLWVIAEAAGLRLGLEGSLLARGLSLVCAAASVAYVWLLARELGAGDGEEGAGGEAGLLASVALAASPTLLLWGQGGLEGPLLAAAFPAAVYHASRSGEVARGETHLAWCAAFSLLACLTRPEGHLLALGVWLYLLREPSPPPGSLRAPPARPALFGFGATFLVTLALLGPVAAPVSGTSPGPSVLWRQLASALPVLLLGALVAFALALAIRRLAALLVRRRPRRALAFSLCLLVPLAAYHGFRLAYFGDLFPNPSYVKTAGGARLLGPGLRELWGMISFAGLGGLLAFAAAGALIPGRRPLRLLGGGLVAAFLVYFVSVGGDDMPLYRLFLPALPLAVALAASALVFSVRRWGPPRTLAAAALILPAGILVGSSLLQVERHAPILRTVRAGLAGAHEAMARHISARATAGVVVVFQDMGAAPYAAGALTWIDPIGVVDRHVARQRARAGENSFVAPGDAAAFMGAAAAFRAAMRDYLFGMEPAWIAGVAYVRDAGKEAALVAYRDALEEGAWDDLARLLEPALKKNPHYHRLFSDARFAAHYRLERVWQRSEGYYLVLFRREAGGSR